MGELGEPRRLLLSARDLPGLVVADGGRAREHRRARRGGGCERRKVRLRRCIGLCLSGTVPGVLLPLLALRVLLHLFLHTVEETPDLLHHQLMRRLLAFAVLHEHVGEHRSEECTEETGADGPRTGGYPSVERYASPVHHGIQASEHEDRAEERRSDEAAKQQDIQGGREELMEAPVSRHLGTRRFEGVFEVTQGLGAVTTWNDTHLPEYVWWQAGLERGDLPGWCGGGSGKR